MLKIPLQPYIIFVGAIDSIKEIYVSLDDVLYTVSDIIEAIDICFKSFHVFQLNYPISSAHLWILIQRGIYDFTTKWDSVFTNIEFILNKLKNLHLLEETENDPITV